MLSSKQLRSTATGILSFAVVALAPSLASAEEIFPPVIQQEAGMPCAPTCTLLPHYEPRQCDELDSKPFGQYMGLHGGEDGRPEFRSRPPSQLTSPP